MLFFLREYRLENFVRDFLGRTLTSATEIKDDGQRSQTEKATQALTPKKTLDTLS